MLRPFRPRIERSTRLFLVGDSLAVGLAPPLRALAKDAGIPFESLAKEGTRIDQWAASQVLKQKLEAFRPTLVLVSLGTNDEYLSGDGGAKQAAATDTLLQLLRSPRADNYGLADVVWIGPPTLPKPASNGVVAMIQSKLDSDHYFPSETLTIPRGPDKLHPTAKGYAGWSGAIWQWLS